MAMAQFSGLICGPTALVDSLNTVGSQLPVSYRWPRLTRDGAIRALFANTTPSMANMTIEELEEVVRADGGVPRFIAALVRSSSGSIVQSCLV